MIVASNTLFCCLLLWFANAFVAFRGACAPIVDFSPTPLLDALDHFLYRMDEEPELGREFYAATTPEEMVVLAEHCGILIGADDFRALLRSGSTEFWVVGGEVGANPIAHLQQVFSV